MSRKLLLFWLLTGVALFVFLQVCYPYLFFFNEQSQLFLAEADYLQACIGTLGGLAKWLSEFVVQFFVYPYVGAGLTAFILTCMAYLLGKTVYRISGSSLLAASSWFPIITQVWILSDYNYTFQGLIALWLMLGIMSFCLFILSDRWRIIGELIGGSLLIGLAGSVAFLFVSCCLAYELGNLKKRKWMAFFPFLLCIGLLLALYHEAVIPEIRLAFLPDQYYPVLLKPRFTIYFTWIGIFLWIVLAGWQKRHGWKWKTRKQTLGMSLLLALMFAVWSYLGTMRWADWKMRRYMMLDYYSRTGQWQKIEAACQGKQNNYLYMNLLARALAEQGTLAEKMFRYSFRGEKSLVVNWNRTEDVSALLSDVYFTAGNIALSQRLAFEGYSCARGNYNARLLQRLVQTNLIYGEYAVAEKYIRLLEKSWTYREWAKQQRKFLYNDAEVENDPLLGSKRSLLLSPEDTTQQKVAGEQLETAMQLPILANSAQARTAFEYLMGAYLLKKDMASFQYLIDRYWGTPLLPDLPVAYQEALIVAHEKNPEGLDKYALNKDVLSRYADFRKQVLANRNNRGLAGLLYRSFGDTYWYYVVFK